MNTFLVPEGFAVQLDEADKKILDATWPVAKNFIEMMIKVVSRILMAFISQGEEKILPYLSRMENGESTEAVVQDMCRDFGLSASSIAEHLPPALAKEELYRALGWPQGEEEQK
jgi:hypothetical protein